MNASVLSVCENVYVGVCVSHFCQQMIIGVNSTSTGTLNLHCLKRNTLFSANNSIVIQHDCENSTAVE